MMRKSTALLLALAALMPAAHAADASRDVGEVTVLAREDQSHRRLEHHCAETWFGYSCDAWEAADRVLAVRDARYTLSPGQT